MAPKSSKHSSIKPMKEKEVVAEPEISSEEEDPEEEDQEQDQHLSSPKQLLAEPQNTNGFVSDSGSDCDSDDSGYKVQPVPKINLPTTPATGSIKRASGSNNSNPAKKSKINSNNTPVSSNLKKVGNGNGSSCVSRIWLKDDEIVILTDMYDFKKSKGGVDANLDVSAFYDSVKGDLIGEYTKEQFKSKIKHMKAKYLGIVKKFGKGGDPSGFASTHEAVVFDLSRRVWGHVVKDKTDDINVVGDEDNVVVEKVARENGVGDGKKKKNVEVVEDVVMVEENGEKENEEEEVEEGVVDVSSYKFLQESIDMSMKHQGWSDTAFRLMNENLHLIGKENASELDGEWKELFLEELELNHKKASLMKKQVELVFDHVKKP